MFGSSGEKMANFFHETVISLSGLTKNLFNDQSNPCEAQLEYSYKILSLCEPSTFGFFPVSRAYALDFIAGLYVEIRKLEKALRYLKEAVFVINTFKFKIGAGTILLNYGSLLSRMGK